MYITINMKMLRDALTFVAMVTAIGFALQLSFWMSVIIIAATYYAFLWTVEKNVELGYETGFEQALEDMNTVVGDVVFTRKDDDEDDEDDYEDEDEESFVFIPEDDEEK